MDCDEARALLHPLLDDEIDGAERVRLDAHLRGCRHCSTALTELKRLGDAVRAGANRYRAPPTLATRIDASLPGGDARAVSSRFAQSPIARLWLPLAASVLLTAGLTSGVTLSIAGRDAGRQASEEIVAAHIRSLMADHLTDVASSDQHTVRPWFNGRIDVAPPVRDLAAEGFPLVGGRLDYVGGRDVAALVYRHGPHAINVLVRPAADATATTAAAIRDFQGYLIAEWSADGLAFAAISDLSRDEMERLVHLLAPAQAPASTTPEARR